jgi:hypothetical protein
MNDGVRRSLLAAKIAKMQAEDERELARGDALGLRAAESMARPGWGGVGSDHRSSTSTEVPVDRSVFDIMLHRAQTFRGATHQDGAGQA